jgi:hypothetical protein
MLRIREYLPTPTLLLVNLECTLRADYVVPAFRIKTWDFGRFGFSNEFFREFHRVNPKLPEFFVNLVRKLSFLFAKAPINFDLKGLSSAQSLSFYGDLINLKINFRSSDTLIFTSLNVRELKGLLCFLHERISKDLDVPKVNVILRTSLIESVGLFDLPFTIKNIFDAVKVLRVAGLKIKFFVDTLQLRDEYASLLGEAPTYVPVPGLPGKYRSTPKTFFSIIPSNSRPETRDSFEDLNWLEKSGIVHLIPSSIDSDAYSRLLASSQYLVLPYVPLHYQSRSSGVFAEGLSIDSKPIVPTGTWMSQEIASQESNLRIPIINRILTTNSIISLSVEPNSPVLIKLVTDSANSKVRIKIGKVTSTHHFCSGRMSDEFICFADSYGNINMRIFLRDSTLKIQVSGHFLDRIGFCYFPGELRKLIQYLYQKVPNREFYSTTTTQSFPPELTASTLIQSHNDI